MSLERNLLLNDDVDLVQSRHCYQDNDCHSKMMGTIKTNNQSTLIHRVVDVAIEFTQPLPEIPNWKEFKITTL